MRWFAVAVGAALAFSACSRTPEWHSYEDASGDVRSEIPSNWYSDHNPDLKRRPVAIVTFLGEELPQDEGRRLGAQINVTRVTRITEEMPKDVSQHSAYEKEWLTPLDVLFGAPAERLPAGARKTLPQASDVLLNGKAARTYENGYEYPSSIHGIAPISIRLVDVVVRTEKAYYVVEYLAPREQFEKHRAVFERFLKSFVFGPSA